MKNQANFYVVEYDSVLISDAMPVGLASRLSTMLGESIPVRLREFVEVDDVVFLLNGNIQATVQVGALLGLG